MLYQTDILSVAIRRQASVFRGGGATAVAAGFNPSANQRAFARRNEAQGATVSISS
jgi:hypothetical protein